MRREPDWEALNQLEFMLMRRLTEPLNSALLYITSSEAPPDDEHPAGFWQQRAREQVASVLNLTSAWQALIRYKQGEPLSKEHREPVYLQDLLSWLAEQLQLVSPLHADHNPLLDTNRETTQEALLLLYSVAYTLGPSVHLITQATPSGIWFRVRYARHGSAPCPTDLDAFVAKLGGHWRSEDAAFEMQIAADFIAMNGSTLTLQTSEEFCGFAFYLYEVGKARQRDDMSSDAVRPPLIPAEMVEAYLNPATTNVDVGQTLRLALDIGQTSMLVEKQSLNELATEQMPVAVPMPTPPPAPAVNGSRQAKAPAIPSDDLTPVLPLDEDTTKALPPLSEGELAASESDAPQDEAPLPEKASKTATTLPLDEDTTKALPALSEDDLAAADTETPQGEISPPDEVSEVPGDPALAEAEPENTRD